MTGPPSGLGQPMKKFIAYFRVSTERQGRSGLGLAAQHRKIAEHVAGAGTLTAESCDRRPLSFSTPR
jgi:hypothetical protein